MTDEFTDFLDHAASEIGRLAPQEFLDQTGEVLLDLAFALIPMDTPFFNKRWTR